MRPSLCRIANVACILFLCGIGPIEARPRVALVIGNGVYQNVQALPNPPRDAQDIGDALGRIGFTVTRISNVTGGELRKALVTFGRLTSDAEMAVVFYAGHGIEANGENWLIPVDAELVSDIDIENEAVSLKAITQQVARAERLGLVILDACRVNPFDARMQRAVRTREVTRGLRRVEPNDNVMVAYAAKDGTVAKDGDGRNSPFTTALLRNIEKPGLEINFLFRNVRDDVMASTKREQQPFVYGSLSGTEIYLVPSVPSKPTTEQQKSFPSPDEMLWDLLKGSDVAASFEEFLKRYPASARAGEARAKLKSLTPAQKIAALPPAGSTPASNLFSESEAIQDRINNSAAQNQPQRAVLYDEDPSNPKGTSYVGTVRWQNVSIHSPVNREGEMAVAADIDIPDRKLKMRMTFRQNKDTSLPASHTVDVRFLLPQDFKGGGIANVPGILMKSTQEARGTPLAGLSVKVSDGYFLVGLSNVSEDLTRNIQLLKERTWFDMPLVYNNQRRAILALEKGDSGAQIYAYAFKVWKQ